MPDQPTPAVPPHQSCVACFKGDTTTGFAVEGEAEWCIASLMKVAGLDQETATATFQVFAEQDLGCDPGMVPVGRVEMGVRLCRECAWRTGAHVAVAEPGQLVTVYTQPR
jgi:hypothetical protein